MATEVKKSTQSLGIISLVVAILAFVLAIVPCLGIFAVVPGIIAIVLPIVGLPQANRDNAPRGMLVSGLIIGIVATFISLSQVMVFSKIAENSDKWPTQIEEIVQEIEDAISSEFDGTDFSIRIQNDNETVTIDGNVNSSNDKSLETLEELEGTELLEKLEADTVE